jgi:hypothetical protein
MGYILCSIILFRSHCLCQVETCLKLKNIQDILECCHKYFVLMDHYEFAHMCSVFKVPIWCVGGDFERDQKPAWIGLLPDMLVFLRRETLFWIAYTGYPSRLTFQRQGERFNFEVLPSERDVLYELTILKVLCSKWECGEMNYALFNIRGPGLLGAASFFRTWGF